jgi:glucosamine kinase
LATGQRARIGRDLLEQTLFVHDGVRRKDASHAAIFRNNLRRGSNSLPTPSPAISGGFAPKSSSMPKRATPSPTGSSTGRSPMSAALALDLSGRGSTACSAAAPLWPRPSAPSGTLKPPLDDALGGAVQMAVRIFAKASGAR